MSDSKCVEPAGIVEAPAAREPQSSSFGGARMDIARAGGKAPLFEATAYFEGGWKRVKLADFAGKWVMLCFYPGDFTFV
jgi:peroxiredoxin (alkyl hydroperoxide reductase subunit C)